MIRPIRDYRVEQHDDVLRRLILVCLTENERTELRKAHQCVCSNAFPPIACKTIRILSFYFI